MKRFGTAMTIILGSLLLGVVIVGLFTWPAMLMFGVVHSYWAWLPAFGFWQTLGVLVLANIVFPVNNIRTS